MAKVLVVDDEPDIVRVISKILAARGHQVTSARDGIEAVEMAVADPPDVIILDLNLPRLDGYQVCKRVKADARTARVPVVMMTASYVSVEDATAGKSAGADEYLIKPFLSETLVNNVERLIAQAAAAAP